MEQLTDRSIDLIEQWSDTSDTDTGHHRLLETYINKWLECKDSLDLDLIGDEVWYNVSSALSEACHIRGRLLVIDFFTYCCVNCLHVLPVLHSLQQQHPISSGLLIIGVHSAKFTNEQSVDSLSAALRRYSIDHPVVNDASLRLWNKFGIGCWPTFLVIGPQGQPLLALVGESHTNLLSTFIDTALRMISSDTRWQNASLEPVPISVGSCSSGERLSPILCCQKQLLFPGNSCLLSAGRAVAIGGWCLPVLLVVDTGHHRVLAIDTVSQKILISIGGGVSGFRDGGFDHCLFNSPQGVTASSTAVYVADTGNHAVRKIELHSRRVSTLYGRPADLPGGLRSPWDVCVTFVSDAEVLLISAAGNHQIWAYVLHSTSVVQLGQISLHAGECGAVAGSGDEACRNHQYKPLQAALAQPSGLTTVCPVDSSSTTTTLVIADSESSSVRQLVLNTDSSARSRGVLSTLAGGAKDPTDLFMFGDADTPASITSTNSSALLQHPLALTSNSEGVVYVADTYNHKVKVIERCGGGVSCITLAGSGERGSSLGSFSDTQFDEPSGLSLDESGGVIYVSDTNNHRICRIYLHTFTVDTMELVSADDSFGSNSSFDTADTAKSGGGLLEPYPPKSDYECAACVHVPSSAAHLNLMITVVLGDAALTEGNISRWNVLQTPVGCAISPSGGVFGGDIACCVTMIDGSGVNTTSVTAEFLLLLYVCSSLGLCYRRRIVYRLRLQPSPDSHNTNVNVILHLDKDKLGLK